MYWRELFFTPLGALISNTFFEHPRARSAQTPLERSEFCIKKKKFLMQAVQQTPTYVTLECQNLVETAEVRHQNNLIF
jgi:hypothetical protein